MPIYGIGCDIVQIPRIERIYGLYGQSFTQRILSEIEVQHMLSRDLEPRSMLAFIAKRYAAKEALAKALGTGIGATLSFKQITIMNNAMQRPYFHEHTVEIVSSYLGMSGADRLRGIQLSMSDDYPLAMAQTIIETE